MGREGEEEGRTRQEVMLSPRVLAQIGLVLMCAFLWWGAGQQIMEG